MKTCCKNARCIQVKNRESKKSKFVIFCSECKRIVEAETKDDAIKAWESKK